MLLAACAGGGGDGASVSPFALNQPVAVSYGTVEGVTPVKVSPTEELGGGAVGGLLGLALTAGHSPGSVLLGTAGGALAGGLLGHALEGSDTADRFLIRRADGSTLEVTTEQRDLVVGDCVAIEQGRHTNLRRTARAMCRPGTGLLRDDAVLAEAQHDAQLCQDAKQELLRAQGDAAIAAGADRVRVLCRG
jgi:outer membrane lipoprotein SlyB